MYKIMYIIINESRSETQGTKGNSEGKRGWREGRRRSIGSTIYICMKMSLCNVVPCTMNI